MSSQLHNFAIPNAYTRIQIQFFSVKECYETFIH